MERALTARFVEALRGIFSKYFQVAPIRLTKYEMFHQACWILKQTAPRYS